MTADHEALREQYLATLGQEIASGRSRLAAARERAEPDAPRHVKTAAAVADVTLDWLIAERDRVRAGGSFDEVAARSLLDAD